MRDRPVAWASCPCETDQRTDEELTPVFASATPNDIGPVRLPGRDKDETCVEIQVRHGAYLPHWTCEGGIYALTFRLADSLPRGVLATWERERDEIFHRAAVAKRRLTPSEIQSLAELHSEQVEKYLDPGYGESHFKDQRAARIMYNALAHFDGQRYNLVAWCVMPNHVHVVVHPRPGFELPSICHSWKSFTAKEINRLLGRQGTFWQPEPYDHLIRDEDDFRHAVEYLLANPAAAGLADWLWVGFGAGFHAVTTAVFTVWPTTPLWTHGTHGQDAHAT